MFGYKIIYPKAFHHLSPPLPQASSHCLAAMITSADKLFVVGVHNVLSGQKLIEQQLFVYCGLSAM